MTKLYNRRKDKEKRRLLRKNMTEAERLLWERIRKNQINDYKFRRQYSIKGFVLDFYSPELKLAIEIDGGYHFHQEQSVYDKARQKLIESLQIQFLRFTNQEILANIDDIVEKIRTITNLYLPLNKGKMPSFLAR